MTCRRGVPRRPVATPRAIAGLLVAAGLLAAAAARADTVDDHLARGRALYDRGDFARARDELLAAYQLAPRPELLFALGQVELNGGRFALAIEYYERFIATDPGADQVALAQQAIGAARARLAEKPVVPLPPPPPRQRFWDDVDSGLAALGGAVMLAGGGLVIYGHHAAGDHGGTLSQYNARFSRAITSEWVGAACLAAGALTAGGAVLRWRIHLVDTALGPTAGPGTAGMTWTGQW